MNENSNQNSSVYDLPRNMSFVASRFFGNFTNNATLYPLTDLSTIMPEFYALYSKASDRWKVFDVEEKTDYVMLVILIGWEGNSESQEVEEKVILDELKEKLHYFFDELDNDVSDKWMMAWQVLSDQEAREITKLGLINLALKAYVNSYPEADFDTIFSYGISLYYEDNTPLSSIPFLEKLRLYKLRENLKSIDLKKIEHLKV